MSSQNTQTTYNYSGSSATSVGDFGFNVTASSTFSDTEAGQLYDALVAAFPASLQVNLSVLKQTVVQTNYTTSATTPPTFS